MAILDYDGTDGSVGKEFTDRDRLAFDVYKLIAQHSRFTMTKDGPQLENAAERVAMAYQIVDAFLSYRRDKA